MHKDCTEEIKDAQVKIQELEQQEFSQEEFRKHMDTVRATLEDARRDAAQGMVTAQWVSRYIDKIFVTPEEDGSLRLDIRIFTGESTQKYLKNLRLRMGQMSTESGGHIKNPCESRVSDTESSTGHMFKKMIEAYEQSMQ